MISKIPVKNKIYRLRKTKIDLKDYKNTENKYSLNTSFIKLRGGEGFRYRLYTRKWKIR